MKTVLIYDSCGTDPLRFAVVEGDWSKYQGLYINTWTKDKKLQKLLEELYTKTWTEDGQCLLDLTEEFPVDAVRSGANVVTIGFLP